MKRLVFAALLLLLTGCRFQPESDCYRIAVLSWGGVWVKGLLQLEELLKEEGWSFQRISPDGLKEGLSPCCSLIVVPGGDAFSLRSELGQGGMEAIANFVERGGSYLGICAGAYAVSKEVVWMGQHYRSPVYLFGGRAEGPLDELAPWPLSATVRINLKGSHPALPPGTKVLRVLYWGGPAFTWGDAEVLAIYELNSLPAIVAGRKGGKWVLLGVHPEASSSSGFLLISLIKWLLSP